jgi:hypothetical protein
MYFRYSLYTGDRETIGLMLISNQPAPVRVTITLPYQVACELRDRAVRDGRRTSNLAAFLLEDGLGGAKRQTGSHAADG